MANLRQVTTEDQVDREAESIKRFLKSENEPVIIAWGTAEGMEFYRPPEVLEALKAQHQAIDRLFAELIQRDSNFFPSKSGQPWEAAQKGNALIQKLSV